jgi:hypothetical protein
MQFKDMVTRLSDHQRTFLIGHCDTGFRTFVNEPIENKTRRALIIRGLIRYEPRMPGRLGKPQGTVLTDPEGRDAVCMVLGQMWDHFQHALNWPHPVQVGSDREKMLWQLIVESIATEKTHER